MFFNTTAPIASATLVSGARRETWPPARLDALDHTRYAPPIHDSGWPDDTLVAFDLME